MNENLKDKIIRLENSSWHIEEQIDEGGFGVIHRAKSAKGERAVAKFIPKSPGAERELLFENLEDLPNVVPVLDRGEWGDKWVLIMPEADKSLSDYIEEKGGRFEVEEAKKILRNVAEALVGLVDVKDNIVHRDIKPSNILLLNHTWCLADFGISRYAEATTAVDTRKYYMTWPYAAPEQWRNERATSATDVYALGVVAYELLAGKRPFHGPQLEDYRHQHLNVDPEPLEEIPENLRSLIVECLYKVAESRPTPKNIMQRLQNVALPGSDAAKKLQQANAVVVNRRAEESRRESIAKTERARRIDLAQVAEQSLLRIVSSLNEYIMENAPNVNHAGRSWTLSQAKLSIDSLEYIGPPWRDRNHDLPFDVVCFSRVTIDIPRDSHGYEGRSHSLWYCDAKVADAYRWFETAFMYCPLRRISSAHNPFALDPEESASEALSTVSGTEFQAAWPFTAIDQGNESKFIEQWIGWFGDAASGTLYSPNYMPEKDPEGSWRRR
ncbi:MAG: serine/threonine-protein kinase [Gemmatimonadetes bacterium]|nr:serine/threonine-protein kinase [Gemmatimonadota bacterium]